jgi:Glyoxalase-like domain
MNKKKLALCLLAACAASAANLRVDHVTIAGRNLKEMREKFSAAGIRTEYGGKHTNGLSEMALASFADGSYLELIAAQDPMAGAPKHYWGKFIDENGGPCAWAIAVEDLDSAAKRLGASITASGRKRPDGVELKWRSASFGPEAQGTFFPFMIHDETDRALRAYPSGKPTMPEWRGVAEVYIGVRNLDEAVKRYRDAFQLGEPQRSFDRSLGAETAKFEGTPVILAHASKTGWLAERVNKFGEAPCAFVMAGSNGRGKVRWLKIEGMKIGVR